MTIRSDSQGFLVGELVESNKDLIAGQNTGNRLLGGIKTDVSAIARALGVSSRSGGGRSAGGNSRAAVEPAGRGSSARNGASGGRSSGSASAAAQRTGGFGAANARTTVSPTGRDSRGRFVAGAGGTGKSGGMDGAGGSRLLDKLGSVTDALKGMAGAGDQVDPSITAMKEVKDVVSPLGRGAMALFGRSGEQKKERWFQKIWKSLTNIEKKPSNTGPGGMPSTEGGDSFWPNFSSVLGGGTLVALGSTIAAGLVTALGILGPVALGTAIASGIALAVRQWLTVKPGDPGYDPNGLLKKPTGELSPAGKSGREFGLNLEKGISEQTSPYQQGKFAPPVLDSRGRNFNDPRRLDRSDAVAPDGRMLNDPRRLDAEVSGVLPPATSVAQRIGRFIGGIKQLFKSGDGANEASPMVSNGSPQEIRSGGSRSWRNRNQGNLEYGDFAKRMGATGTDGRFAIFPSEEAGRKAQESLIFESESYKNLSLKDAISRYAPPAENNTQAYQNSILASVGSQNKRMGDYSASERAAIMGAMQKVEGFRVGRTTTAGIPATVSAGLMSPATALPTFATGVQMPTAAMVPMGYPSKLPAIPDVTMPTPSAEKDRPVSVIVRQPIGQNVSDRAIAHVATGGIGATGTW